MENLNKFFTYFGKNRKSFILYASLSFIVGMLELFGVALTYPFVLKLLSENGKSGAAPLLIGIAILLLFLTKNLFMIFYTYLQAKFTKSIEAEANLKFMQFFLTAPYIKTSKISLAKKSNILGFLLPNVINNYILRILNLIVNCFIFILITGLLVVKFPIASLLAIVFAVALIISQNLIFKPILTKIAKNLQNASVEYNQKSNEALINLKGVKISGKESYFYNNYKAAVEYFNKNLIKNNIINSMPPYVIEPCIIILLFILLGIISCQTYQEPNKLIASFALIVSAIFRLSPTISRIQVNINGINAALPIVKDFLLICEQYKINTIPSIENKKYTQFNKEIRLENIYFEYEENKPVLKNINLAIKKGEFIGIAGLSGCGKTTLLDIISGLFKPLKGNLIVDDKPLNGKLKIGYVPQEFSTISASIMDNVTYGNKIADEEKVIKALKNAQLYDFITENYKNGIHANPFVDSQGLSQGQKQRLAIARALYMEPDILILDEATSSLDLKTEDEFCSVLNQLKGKVTIIAVAHRLSTIKNADRIVFMNDGNIEASGSFDELVTTNKNFKELARLSQVKSL